MGNQSKAKRKRLNTRSMCYVFWTTSNWIERQALINLKTNDLYTKIKIINSCLKLKAYFVPHP